MTSEEIWSEVYDKGYKNGADTLPFKLKQLWYYIDFTIYIDNGGSIGFLYNKSATEDEKSDYFQPYIESWIFFELLELVSLVEDYNKRYLEAIKNYNRNDKTNFDLYRTKFNIEEIENKIDPVITKIVWIEKNQKVWSWIDSNINELEQELKSS